jgi:hypothetical protein
MKCPEKERPRRYETANAFANDLERYLNGDVVEARSRSAGYRLRKFIRKHRVAITTVSAFVGLLIAAAGTSAGLAIRARRADRNATRNAQAARGLAQDLCPELAKSAIAGSSLQIDPELAEVETEPRKAILSFVRNEGLQSDQR